MFEARETKSEKKMATKLEGGGVVNGLTTKKKLFCGFPKVKLVGVGPGVPALCRSTAQYSATRARQNS